MPREDVHPWPPRERIPAGPFKHPKKRGLIQVPERIAIIGVNDLFNVGEVHADRFREL